MQRVPPHVLKNDIASLAGYRHSGRFGAAPRYFERVTSTNTRLLEDGAGLPEGSLYLAEEQTSGRGRLQRRWNAPPGSSLLFSLLLRPPQPFATSAVRATMICGLALRAAIAQETGLTPHLKWPNDLILLEAGDEWRKLAGMLSEVGLVGGEPDFLVVGIGLNVNLSAPQLALLAPNAGSLAQATGGFVSRAPLLERFLTEAEAFYTQMCAGWDPLAEWQAALAWMGAAVEVTGPAGPVAGIAEGVADDGALVLRLADGARAHFGVGDVSLRRGGGVGQ